MPVCRKRGTKLKTRICKLCGVGVLNGRGDKRVSTPSATSHRLTTTGKLEKRNMTNKDLFSFLIVLVRGVQHPLCRFCFPRAQKEHTPTQTERKRRDEGNRHDKLGFIP